MYFALAVLNKPKLSAELSSKILEAEAAQKQALAQAKDAPIPFKKLGFFDQALMKVKIREELTARKRIVDKAVASGISISTDEIEVEKLRNDEIAKILFVINTGNDTTGLKDIVGAKITGLGFKALDKLPEKPLKNQTYMIIRCGMEMAPLDKSNKDWKFYDWSVREIISDSAAPDEELAVLSRRGQSSHLTDEAAKNKAVNDASAALAEETGRWINKYIFGK